MFFLHSSYKCNDIKKFPPNKTLTVINYNFVSASLKFPKCNVSVYAYWRRVVLLHKVGMSYVSRPVLFGYVGRRVLYSPQTPFTSAMPQNPHQMIRNDKATSIFKLQKQKISGIRNGFKFNQI